MHKGIKSFDVLAWKEKDWKFVVHASLFLFSCVEKDSFSATLSLGCHLSDPR
jgi:hypothetical protein